MSDPNFILLYVEAPLRSANFYGDLLGKKPVESAPTFAMFALDSGVMLGLWAKHKVAPAAGSTGGSEIAFSVESPEQVNSIYRTWVEKGLAIAQPPVDMDFGHTFTALDPDGHRLRVFSVFGQ